MRRTGALLFPARGRRPFHYYHCTCSLFPFSASAPWLASQSFAEITAKDIGRGARPYPERARGWRIWRSGNIHEKAIDGPHQLTLFSSVPRTCTHTYLATASNYSGRFPPSTGNPGFEGCKKTNSSNTTTIRTLHLSTTSRDANPPRGEQQKVQSTTKTASPSKAQKYYYPMIFNTQSSSLRSPAPPPYPDTRFCILVGTRAELVSLFTHKHTHHIHIPPDFSRPRKELSRSREKSEGFTNAPLRDSNTPVFSPPKYSRSLCFPFSFRIFHGPLGTAWGEGR